MNKELFVSSTPHETKVGIVEDDQLAEIYLERENEYTLAGSIYKGRVTRVLPGMQSAFVDIGLERDAFLYVSDFMDLEQQDEDLDEAIPATRAVPEASPRRSFEAAPAHEAPAIDAEVADAEAGSADAVAQVSGSSEAPRTSHEWRGRRRRRGRRDRPEDRGGRADRTERGDRDRNATEARFQRPTPTARTGRDYDYGPPPGYQPIILPGESISKYRQGAQHAPSPAEVAAPGPDAASVNATFPDDEPMFATELAPPLERGNDHIPRTDRYEETQETFSSAPQAAAEEAAAEAASSLQPPLDANQAAGSAVSELAHEADFAAALELPGTGDIEEQEIEEEEADLASYGEHLEDDGGFEDLEEETHAAGAELPRPDLEQAPASLAAESAAGEGVESGDEVSEAALEEEDEQEAEELEVEEAQEEAEALLEAEAIGDGRVDASAQVRAPAPEARLMQRTQRSAPFDRHRGRRGGRRFRRRENTVVPQISDLLKEGQEVLIQIAKEPIGKKGARITSHIALPGRFLVFMPTVNHTGVSRKISSEEERQRLKRIIVSERENGAGGFIVRTAAAGASDDELRADIRFLKNLWNEIKSRSEASKSPALIYHDLNVVERVLRDQVSSEFSVIWVDTEQEFERILRFANRFQPSLVRRVKLYTKETPLFEQFGLNEEINKALKSKVWLKSGGYIVINQTEALVAIDVNTGKYVGKTARLEDTIVKTNVDAIREIVRQVRLRDLGGIIVIDFIDMDERRNRQKVMQALEESLRADRAPSKVLQFNDFGLVAITRKRVKQSLERTIGSPCPYCQSTGFVKSVSTICNEVYVEVRKIARHLEHSDVMLRVNPEVAKVLKANNARLLNEMEELTKKTIIVKSDPALHQEQFDIH
jgi:Rne/Rng family ribonuclease